MSNENTILHIYDKIAGMVYSRENYTGEVLIDTRKFANGIYVYMISQDDQNIESNKFIITH